MRKIIRLNNCMFAIINYLKPRFTCGGTGVLKGKALGEFDNISRVLNDIKIEVMTGVKQKNGQNMWMILVMLTLNQ